MTPSILTPKGTEHGRSFYGMVDYDELTVYTKFGVMDFSDQEQFNIFVEHNQIEECEFIFNNFSFFEMRG